MVAFFAMPENAFAPTEVFLSLEDLIVMDCNFLQFANACLPMIVVVDGITILVNEVHLPNALVPISATFLPSVTDFNFGQL